MARSIQAKTQCFEARFMTLRARFDTPLNAGIMWHPIFLFASAAYRSIKPPVFFHELSGILPDSENLISHSEHIRNERSADTWQR